jgi:hypothetical protein
MWALRAARVERVLGNTELRAPEELIWNLWKRKAAK